MKKKLKSRALKIFNYLLSKKVFSKPKSNKIVIFDMMQSEFLKKIIKRNNVEILCTRGEVLNLYVLTLLILNNFFLIFSLKKLRLNYFILYLKIVNPKLIITYCDNDPFFYTLKPYFSNKIFISVQNGYRYYGEDFFEVLKNRKISNLSCDYIFCFNEQIAKYYRK